ncbi:hypothetical protein [Haloarcula marina]|uniref:hypothetical protein n=1 Tax=Haloarcula marina TaxID=2961574 RepID=UPI0020B639D2|nr:hypothetical protein [Halomicroarcula marina]
MVTWGVPDAGTGEGEIPAVEGEHTRWPTKLLEQLDERREAVDRPIPRPTDAAYAGEATRLRLPEADVTVTAMDFEARYHLRSSSELPTGTFLLSGTVERRPDGSRTSPLTTETVEVFVLFDGPASLRPTDDGTVLSLWDSKPVTVGFSEGASDPPRVVVPPTAEGLATGLSCLSAAHHTSAPMRSHPDQRDHPPLLTTGETESVPQSVAADHLETDIHLRLPSSIDALFVAAPLAYYLGADVRVEDRERAVLTAEGTDLHREFDPLPGLQEDVATVLRHVFYFDCLVRRLSPERNPELLDAWSLDPAELRSLSPGVRLARYLSVPSAEIRESVPEWHLATFARPSTDRIRCLPFLLDKLSLVYLPDASELDRSDLLERTLTDAYPTRGASTPSTMLDPGTGRGHINAWLAPGTPIDAFKTTPTAYENRYRYHDTGEDRVQVAVVLNDDSMADEHGAVADIYRDAALPVDVTLSEHLTRRELGAVFEASNDFVHFIGHCEEDGLRCRDGPLSTATLSTVRTRTFFLNACGSFDQGMGLVENGSVAGAVTFTDVLDDHAATVGRTFARLLSNGFSIQRALQLARRRIMMGKDYTVVGDGTDGLLPTPSTPVVVWVSEAADEFHVVCEVVTPRAGESYSLPFGDASALNGRQAEFTMDEAELVRSLAATTVPVVFEGEFHWSSALASRLRGRA